jgi:hypothetical protein
MLDWLNGKLFGAGARTASLYHRALGLVLLVAWISLGVQVRVLMGARGLLPAQRYLDELNAAGIDLWTAPSWLRAGAADSTLVFGVFVGAAMALLCAIGRPRVAVRPLFAAQALLYVGYCVAGRTFFQFQWDQLFVESALLASFLPANRDARVPQMLLRLLLFKLYFESGIAKWQSHLHDWQDGSAMSHYYETAPIPSALGYWAHFLPIWWHTVESWATLVLELILPFGVFVPWRRARVGLFVALTGFQLINFATANYGFFVPLAVTLHVFLLDDTLIERAAARLRVKLPEILPARRFSGVLLFAPIWLLLSADRALGDFVDVDLISFDYTRVYVFNTYHLFGHITTKRVEPEIQALVDGNWQPVRLRYQPGDPRRSPSQAAPHQPRVDFQMWFYGLGFRRGAPDWVQNLAQRICDDPDAVQPLFAEPLPKAESVRLVFWLVKYVTPDERRHTGVVWSRAYVDETRPLICGKTHSGLP